MTTNVADEEMILTERRLLQWLCQDRVDAALRTEVQSRLKTYAFRSVEHQVLFDCLRRLPPDRPDLIKSLLPARMVRAGFPDFDLDPFFEPCSLSPAEARKLSENLVAEQADFPAENRLRPSE